MWIMWIKFAKYMQSMWKMVSVYFFPLKLTELFIKDYVLKSEKSINKVEETRYFITKCLLLKCLAHGKCSINVCQIESLKYWYTI